MKKILITLLLILTLAIPPAQGDTIIYGGFIPTISSSTNNGLLCWSGTYGNTVKDCSGAPTFDASGNLVANGFKATGETASRLAIINSDKVISSNAALTSGRVPFADGTGSLSDDADFTFSGSTLTVTNIADVSGNTFRSSAFSSGLPMETTTAGQFTTGTKTGTGSVYVMDTSPTIKGLIFDTSANFSAIDVSPNIIWGSGYTGT